MAETPSYEDRQLTERLFNFLEDRRVLYTPWNEQVLKYIESSITEIRAYLGDLLEKNETGEVLTNSVRSMRGACRRFLNNMERFGKESPTVEPASDIARRAAEWKLSGELGELRGQFGYEIDQLSKHFELKVPGDLHRVLPAPPE
jgi:hypothetical protein